MSEKKKLERGVAQIVVELYDGRLSVTTGPKERAVLLERDMLEGEWNELWAVLRGDGNER